MITIKDYVEDLFKDIPQSTQRDNIVQEIILNLEEKVQDLVDEGKDLEDAINKSIVEFGDIGEIKEDLMSEVNIDKKGYSKKDRRMRDLNNLWFSIWGTLLIVGLFLFINFYYSPEVIWFVYPTFAILWWPLCIFFVWINRKRK